jgi:hypothetical protein
MKILVSQNRPDISEDLVYTFPVLPEDIGDLALFSSRGPSTALPEDSSILVLWLETLVRRYSPVEQSLAVVEAAQALHQPDVSCNRNI